MALSFGYAAPGSFQSYIKMTKYKNYETQGGNYE